MGSLKPRKVERKAVIDFRHFPHHFVFVFVFKSISGNIAIAEVTMLGECGMSKRSYFSRRGFYKDRFSSICFNVQF